jgi:hypothetical protein
MTPNKYCNHMYATVLPDIDLRSYTTIYLNNGVTVALSNDDETTGIHTYFMKNGFCTECIGPRGAWDPMEGLLSPLLSLKNIIPEHDTRNNIKCDIIDPDCKLYVRFESVPKSLRGHYHMAISNTPWVSDSYIMSDGKDIYWMNYRLNGDWLLRKILGINGGFFDMPKNLKRDALDVANEVYEYMVREGLL